MCSRLRLLLYPIAFLCAAESAVAAEIHDSVEAGDLAAVQALLEANAVDVNAANHGDRFTPLHLAILTDRPEIAALLVVHGADIEALDVKQRTPLELAVRVGDTESAKLLVNAGADVHKKNREGMTPLHVAAKTGQMAAATLLLAAGADVNQEGRADRTPLFHARTAEMTKLLIEAGAKIGVRDEAKTTPLVMAVRDQRRGAAAALLEHGADVNERDDEGCPIIHVAFIQPDPRLKEVVLRHKPDLRLRDAKGHTVLHYAAMRTPADIALLERLLDAGAEINARDYDDGHTALAIATMRGHEEAVRFLVKRGADVNLADLNGQTPLFHALRDHGRSPTREQLDRIAALLRENGAID